MRPESPPSVPQPSASTGSSECRAIDLAAPASHQPAPQADAVWSPSPDRRLKTGRLLRTALRSLAVLALASLTLHAWSERRAAERLTERLALGCFDVADCRALLLAAQARHSACLTSCGSEVEQVRQAREQFAPSSNERLQSNKPRVTSPFRKRSVQSKSEWRLWRRKPVTQPRKPLNENIAKLSSVPQQKRNAYRRSTSWSGNRAFPTFNSSAPSNVSGAYQTAASGG